MKIYSNCRRIVERLDAVAWSSFLISLQEIFKKRSLKSNLNENEYKLLLPSGSPIGKYTKY